MKKFLAMALAAVMVLGVAGCGSSSDEKTEENTENTEQTGETTEGTDGVIKMGVSADFPPFESYADDAVTFVGFDIDLMQEICNRLGMELQIKDMNFDAIVTAVQTGKLDVGVSGITITDERKESVAFSDPYFVASQSILVPKDSPITSYEDLINGDYTAGVQLGTTGDIMASEKISGRVSQYEKYGDALAALLAGKNDCMVLDTGVGTFGEATDSENYGIAIAKENTELLEKVNGALAEMKEDGFIDELTAKYFE